MKFNLLVEQILQQLNENRVMFTLYDKLLSYATNPSILQKFNIKPNTNIKKYIVGLRSGGRKVILKELRDQFKNGLIRTNYRNINTKTEDEQETILDSYFDYLLKHSTDVIDDRILNMLKTIYNTSYKL